MTTDFETAEQSLLKTGRADAVSRVWLVKVGTMSAMLLLLVMLL